MVELRGVLSGYQSDKNVLDDCIPSVREQAVLFEVNTNTVVKTYDLLLQWGIIIPGGDWDILWLPMH